MDTVKNIFQRKIFFSSNHFIIFFENNKMDTRFWGPSGWRLLHLITFTYQPSNVKHVKEFFETLPYVLPCKFCRASLTEYMRVEPIESALESRSALTHWLFRIHNLVNEKLKGQGLLHERNPSFDSVKKVYEERVKEGCMRTNFEGWDFLFSIAENHPYSVHGATPMPNAPPQTEVKGDEERNRWNYLKPGERIPYYLQFWKALVEVLPFEEWKKAWKGCKPRMEKLKKSAGGAKRELWRIRCCLERKLELVNQEKFESVCKRLVEHKSGCNKTKKARTCRRITKKIHK